MVKTPKKSAPKARGKAAKPRAEKPAEAPKPSTHNFDAEERSIVAVQLGKMVRGKEVYDSANGTYRALLKHCEAKGIHLKAAKDMIGIKDSQDRVDFLAYVKHCFMYAAVLGWAITSDQLELFETVAARTPEVELAKVKGRMAALRGDGEGTIPYAVESKQGQAWLEAFRSGLDERKLILEMDSAVGDEQLLKGPQDGEDDVLDPEDEPGEDAPPDPGEDVDPEHAAFDAGGDPGAELEPDVDQPSAVH